MTEPLPYRLLAVDIDGTVLDSRNRLRPAVKDALERVHRAGVTVVLCTGRRFKTTHEIRRELESAADVVICSGGAAVKEAETGRTIFSCPVMPDLVVEICRALRRWGLVPVALPDMVVGEREVLVSCGDQARMSDNLYFEVNAECVDFYDGELPPGYDCFLEVYACDLRTRIDPAYQKAVAAFAERTRLLKLRQLRYGPEYLAVELMDRRVSKAWALNWLIEQWDLVPEQVIAVGDDVNDLEMIRMAGLGVAMGNAAAAVLEAADRCTLDNDHDGLAVALREILPHLFAQETVSDG